MCIRDSLYLVGKWIYSGPMWTAKLSYYFGNRLPWNTKGIRGLSKTTFDFQINSKELWQLSFLLFPLPRYTASVWQQELKESSYSWESLPALLFLRQSCPTILKFVQVLSKTFKVLADFERVVLSSFFPKLARSEALKNLVPFLWNVSGASAGLNALARASKDWKSFRSREKAHGSVCPPFWILTVDLSGVRSCLFWWLHRFSDSIVFSFRPH